MKLYKKILLGFLLLFGITEFGLRFLGLGNFPVYQVDPEIGYIAAPSQSGKFLNKNDWHFNDLSMGNSQNFSPGDKNNLLLIGDSIVQGGNPYKHSDKLGPQLQNQIQSEWNVWSVGAPSWGFLNQQEYLKRYPQVLSAIQGIVWIFNSGDFQDRSTWWTDATHPRYKPFFLSYYALNKYLLEGKLQPSYPSLLFWIRPPQPASQKPLDAQWDVFTNELQNLKNYSLIQKWVILYPNQNEHAHPQQDFYQSLADRLQTQLTEENWGFLDLRKSEHWKQEYYRDFIHPTPEGNRVLSEQIAHGLKAEK